MIPTPADARATLRDAIAARALARTRRDDARAALARADATIADVQEYLAGIVEARGRKESDAAAELADALRFGDAEALRDAVVGYDEMQAESSLTIAKAARGALVEDLRQADEHVAAAEYSVRAAALGVVAADSFPLGDELRRARAHLIAVYDRIVTLEYLGLDFRRDEFPRVPPEVGQIILEALAITHPVDLLRPPKILSAGTAKDIAAQRTRDWLACLCDDSELTLEDVPAPDLKNPNVAFWPGAGVAAE